MHAIFLNILYFTAKNTLKYLRIYSVDLPNQPKYLDVKKISGCCKAST